MTRFYLIRHASNDFIGKRLAGRLDGVHLNAKGIQEAESLVERLSHGSIQRIYSSPLDRAVETAQPLARCLNLPVQISPEILEVDFGDWTGKTLDELAAMEGWKKWNLFRSGFRIPNGELMSEVQARMIGFLDEVRRSSPGENVALFSHADPIKTVLVYYLGAPLELLARIEIDPASVSIIELDDWGARIVAVNTTR